MFSSNFSNHMSKMIKSAPLLLFVSMVLSFLLMFFIQVYFYAEIIFHDHLPLTLSYAVAVAIGLITQFSRLSFGVAGAMDFANNRIFKGILGIGFSFALAAVETYEVLEMAMFWAKDNDLFFNAILMILVVVVWLGFFLEIRIAMSVSSSSNVTAKTKKAKKRKKKRSVKVASKSANGSVFSSNGTTPRGVKSVL